MAAGLKVGEYGPQTDQKWREKGKLELRFLHWKSSLSPSASLVGDFGVETGVKAEVPASVDEIMMDLKFGLK